jgi:peptidyl-prolyl cis-trans isomerase SurA
MNGRFYWVDIKKVLEPSVKPLSETKGKVISDYQAELERQWIEKLKEKYPIKVDRKTLKKTVEYLEN